MKRVTFFLSLALGLSAQDPGGVPSLASGAVADAASSVASPRAGRGAGPSRKFPSRSLYGGLSGNLPTRTGHLSGWNRLQPGQSAAIGLESGGDPAKQGAPVKRVEASHGPGGYMWRIRHFRDEHGYERWWHECVDCPEDFGVQTVEQYRAQPAPLPLHTPTAGWWKRHLADTAAHATGTALDAASSWGQREANPVLRSDDGRFGVQGAITKVLIFAGSELVKWKLARRYPRSKLVRAISLVPAAAFGSAAARNWSVR